MRIKRRDPDGKKSIKTPKKLKEKRNSSRREREIERERE